MTLNWVEIDQVLTDMDLEGTYIQEVRQLNYKQLVLDTYRSGRPFSVLIDLDGQTARIHPFTQRVKPMKPHPRFCEFLRARVKGARITRARQWNHDRIVEIRTESAEETITLWIRLWGSQSNILACGEDNTILDAAFRRPRSQEVSGALYHPQFDPKLLKEKKGPEKEYQLREISSEFTGSTWADRLEQSLLRSTGEEWETLLRRAVTKCQGEVFSLESRLQGLSRQVTEAQGYQDWKVYADLILSAAHELTKGQESWTGTDYRTGQTLQIPLDPLLTPQENAQKLYKKHSKLKENLERLGSELQSAQKDWEGMAGILHKLENETDRQVLDPLVDKILKELSASSGPPAGSAPKKIKNPLPGIQLKRGIFTLLIGRNAKENDELLRRGAKGNDTWIHVRGGSGGYVFIKGAPNKSLTLEIILDGCQLALWYSKLRGAAKAELYVTQVKFLRRVKDGPLGLVIPTQEKNYTIEQKEDRVKALLDGRDED